MPMLPMLDTYWYDWIVGKDYVSTILFIEFRINTALYDGTNIYK